MFNVKQTGNIFHFETIIFSYTKSISCLLILIEFVVTFCFCFSDVCSSETGQNCGSILGWNIRVHWQNVSTLSWNRLPRVPEMRGISAQVGYLTFKLMWHQQMWKSLIFIVGEWGWGVEGKQVGSMDEESQVRGCYNITFICTPTNQETVSFLEKTQANKTFRTWKQM